MLILTERATVELERYPDCCPFCHRNVTPIPVYGKITDRALHALFHCPNSQCDQSFIGYYNRSGHYFLYSNKTSQGQLMQQHFATTIQGISPSFDTIYNQAYVAEQQGLAEICGVGYRKALEFLIKDYLISNQPNSKEQIEKKFLGSCILDDVTDVRIKAVAKRAVWLGNDETHYVRKWEGKNLEDMKKLIELTVHWIEMELLSKSFEEQMPG